MWSRLKNASSRWLHRRQVQPPSDHHNVPFNPVNYSKRNPAEIQTDVEFSIRSARLISGFMRDRGIEPNRAHFLELGPGTHFGAPLILASMGVQVTLADRFLARWQEQYHPALYRELHRAWDGPKRAIEAVLDANGYPDGVLNLLEEPGESLVSLPAESVDFTYSNAVLEHVVEMRRVAQELSRIMRRGATGAHQVDMRYHADFTQPLEHLVMSDDEYAQETAVHGFERGNRLRPSEFIALFESCGLQVTEFDGNCQADPAYLADAVQRLRLAQSSYRRWPEGELSSIGGRFFIRKLDGGEAQALKQSAEERLLTYAHRKGEYSS